MEEFKYLNNSHCFCGHIIKANKDVVEKQYTYGKIIFCKCYNCNSYLQSPKISFDSLVEWYNSPNYSNAVTTNKIEGPYLDYFADEDLRKVEYQQRYARDLQPILKSKSKVLEIGCATGTFLSVIQDKGHEVYGVDVSDVFVKEAKKLYKNISFQCGDFSDMDLPTDYFDCIILLGTISNLYDIEVNLKKINRILKSNGILYFNIVPSDTYVVRLYGNKHWMFTPSVINFFSKKGINAALERNEFKITKFARDVQLPSLKKIINLSKMHFLVPLFNKLNLLNKSLPIPLPIPGVYSIICSKMDELNS